MNQDWLAQLDDIILPAPIGWWPLAPSVWTSLIVVGFLLIGLAWFLWKKFKTNLYRREAKQQLKNLKNLDDNQFLLQINKTLKQTAITAYGRGSCASLDGDEWLKFLKSKAQFLQQPESLLLLTQRYETNLQPLEKLQRESLTYYVIQWINGHHL